MTFISLARRTLTNQAWLVPKLPYYFSTEPKKLRPKKAFLTLVYWENYSLFVVEIVFKKNDWFDRLIAQLIASRN